MSEERRNDERNEWSCRRSGAAPCCVASWNALAAAVATDETLRFGRTEYSRCGNERQTERENNIERTAQNANAEENIKLRAKYLHDARTAKR